MKSFLVLTLIFVSTLIFEGPVLCAKDSGGIHVSCCCSNTVRTIDVPPCCGSKCRNFKFSKSAEAILLSKNETEAPYFHNQAIVPFYFSSFNITISDITLSRFTVETKPRPPDKHIHLSSIILIC